MYSFYRIEVTDLEMLLLYFLKWDKEIIFLVFIPNKLIINFEIIKLLNIKLS